MHDSKRVCFDKATKEFDSIPAHVAAFVLETPTSQFRNLLSPLGELLLKVAELDVDLKDSASAVRVNVKEALLQDVEECVELGLVVFASFLLFTQIDQHVTADLDESTAQCV